MCIIATKPIGKELFPKTMIETMFKNNSDGAGYMYAKCGKVFIRKGFMTVEDLLASLDSIQDVKDLPLVMHCRIGTHGGNTASNTHPFPVTSSVDDLQSLDATCTLGMAHNGVIHFVTPRSGISDTMEYILQVVDLLQQLDKNFYLIEQFQTLLSMTAKSKLAFLDHDGTLVTIGEFVEHDGYRFSNTSYEPKPVITTPIWRHSYDEGNDDGYAFSWNDRYKNVTPKLPAPKKRAIKKGITLWLSPIPAGAYVLSDPYDHSDYPIVEELDCTIHLIDNQLSVYELQANGIDVIKVARFIGKRVYDEKDDHVLYWFNNCSAYLYKGEVR